MISLLFERKPIARSTRLKLTTSRPLFVFTIITIGKIAAFVAAPTVAGRFAFGFSFYVFLVKAVGKGISIHSENPLFFNLI